MPAQTGQQMPELRDGAELAAPTSTLQLDFSVSAAQGPDCLADAVDADNAAHTRAGSVLSRTCCPGGGAAQARRRGAATRGRGRAAVRSTGAGSATPTPALVGSDSASRASPEPRVGITVPTPGEGGSPARRAAPAAGSGVTASPARCAAQFGRPSPGSTRRHWARRVAAGALRPGGPCRADP
jgi:hypothetical protein